MSREADRSVGDNEAMNADDRWGPPTGEPGYGQAPDQPSDRFGDHPGSQPSDQPRRQPTGPEWREQWDTQWGAPADRQSPWSAGPPMVARPPVIEFHPLTLGELFEGTFAAIRSNPRVMFTFSIITFGVIGLLAALINTFAFAAWGFGDALLDESLGPGFPELLINDSAAELTGLMQLSVIQTAFSVLQNFAMLLVDGMLVLAVTNAVVGVNLDMASSWKQLRPRLWRLVLVTLLVWAILAGLGLILVGSFAIPALLAIQYQSNAGVFIALAFLIGIAAIVLMIWVGIRLSFATLIVVVENVAVTVAIQRSWRLTSHAVWRLLGRYVLLGITMSIAMSLLGGAVLMAVAFATSFAPAWVSGLVGTLLLAILAGFAQPVSSSYTALMYVDERMRKEGLAPVLAAELDRNRAAEAGRP